MDVQQRSEDEGYDIPSEEEIVNNKGIGDKARRVIEARDDDHSFALNEAVLEELLLNPNYADKKVCIISVAGAYRKGKSFLLNFFIRYLNTKHVDSVVEGDWLKVSGSLDGFSWRGGSERETTGILIWSDPFILKNKDGEDIVVFLMDTQGAFDTQSTVKDCATIFALSTMVSSVQIFNLTQNVQEDDLQHLQLFTEYGRLAMEDTSSKPFQSLLFLVRDWSYPYEAEFGFQGGERILENRLKISERQHPELQQLRQHIKSCFENIGCFLLPHPGLSVATNPNFRGEIDSIETEFVQQLRVLIPRILDPNGIVVKKINGHDVSCRELLEYFKAYINIFQGEDLPEPKSMLIATAEANNLAAVSNAKAHYVRQMEEICGGDTPYMATAELEEQHIRCRNSSIAVFKNARKMGGVEFSLQFLEKLDSDISEQFESFIRVNNGKNLFKSMRTPAVLVSFMFVDYFFQEIFQLIGVDGIASIFTLMFLLLIGVLCTWVYARYSGQMREAGAVIDNMVNYTWDNFLSGLSQEGLRHVVNVATSSGVGNSSSVRIPSAGHSSYAASVGSTSSRTQLKKEN
ncbi:hypothetical protein L596_004563 [Steinernema carpocapsae]|uniref:GB1/RHD3-type G domain-containing protein n=1 Tax=Steinernema carpocapsae TaxID=34508 RepID=A0A4U8UXT2_STECR|nr:hypothetical protein L596_004563 [Steinernema carpocapsae]